MINPIFHSSCWPPPGEVFVLLSWPCLWWTSLRSQPSVFCSTVAAGWEFSEGTGWCRDLRLDLVNSRGGFQPFLQAGLSPSPDQVSLVVSLSSITGEKRFSFWCGREFGIFPCGIFVCFVIFSSLWCISALSPISILADLIHSCTQSYWSVTCLSLLCTNSYIFDLLSNFPLIVFFSLQVNSRGNTQIFPKTE